MISREELAADEKRKQDKALGALAGLAIGDAFGDAGRVPENHLTYGMMTDFAPGKTWSTDDTEFALFTAVMLIEHRGDPSVADFEEGWKKYIMSQDDFPRGGASEREAVSNLKKGLHAPQTGIYNAYAMSDGAAMRIAPVGIVCAGDPERAAQLAFRDAQVSHSGDGVWAAQAVAAGVSAAMADGTDDEILEQALRVIPSDTWLRYSLEQTRELADKNHRDFSAAGWSCMICSGASTRRRQRRQWRQPSAYCFWRREIFDWGAFWEVISDGTQIPLQPLWAPYWERAGERKAFPENGFSGQPALPEPVCSSPQS